MVDSEKLEGYRETFRGRLEDADCFNKGGAWKYWNFYVEEQERGGRYNVRVHEEKTYSTVDGSVIDSIFGTTIWGVYDFVRSRLDLDDDSISYGIASKFKGSDVSLSSLEELIWLLRKKNELSRKVKRGLKALGEE